MAGSIKIESFKKKEAEEFTACLADPESRLDAGGGAAMCAALSASLLCRAARLTAAAGNTDEALDYILSFIDDDDIDVEDMDPRNDYEYDAYYSSGAMGGQYYGYDDDEYDAY